MPAPDRISELEARLARLDAGWRQHIPQLLDSVSSLEHRASLPKPANERETSEPAQTVAEPPAFYAEMVERLGRAEAQLETLRHGWDAHLPAILEGLSKTSGDAGLAEEAHQRIDAMRRDLDRATARLDAGLSTLRINHVGTGDNLSSAGSNELRVHIRNGGPKPVGYLAVDLAADASLPSEHEAATSVVVAPSVDFGPGDVHARQLLGRLLSILAPRGVIQVERLSLEDIFNAVENGAMSAQQARDMLALGHQLSQLTPTIATLKTLMLEVGFDDVRVTLGEKGIGSVITATRLDDKAAW